MSETPIVDPADIPVVAVPSMDTTHREEVALVNTIGALLREEPVDRERLTGLLDQWVEHTRAHFARENRLMEEGGFPAFPVHSGEHARALALLEDVVSAWKAGEEPGRLEDYVFRVWPRWFHQHVNSMDNVTALFLSRLGVT